MHKPKPPNNFRSLATRATLPPCLIIASFNFSLDKHIVIFIYFYFRFSFFPPTRFSMKPRFIAAVLPLCVLLLLTFAFGQGTDLGTIRGTVTDSSGALVGGASVTVLDVQTGTTRQT